jgi:diguanylate cyclase (GGDEF)-like protein
MPGSRLAHAVSRTPATVARVLVAALAIAAFALCWRAGPALSLSIVYVLPVALAGWLLTRAEAVGVAAMAALGILLVDVAMLPPATEIFEPAWKALSSIGFILLVALLVNRVRDLVLEVGRLDATDPLTGALTALHFRTALEEERSRASRYGYALTVLVVDIEGLPSLAETRGKAAVDRVLATVGATLRATIRGADRVGRLEANEFGVALVECNVAEAAEMSRRLRTSLLEAMWSAGWPITFNIGTITAAATERVSSASLIRRADRAMHEARRASRERADYGYRPTA